MLYATAPDVAPHVSDTNAPIFLPPLRLLSGLRRDARCVFVFDLKEKEC